MAEVSDENIIITNPKKSTEASNPFTIITPKNEIPIQTHCINFIFSLKNNTDNKETNMGAVYRNVTAEPIVIKCSATKNNIIAVVPLKPLNNKSFF
tara:strand:+ start:672 stop:959 length:288 start_codon:yes stop_codon:yes gene_type:complete